MLSIGRIKGHKCSYKPLISVRMTSRWPISQARNRGVCFITSSGSTMAPCSSNKSTVDTCPERAAAWSATHTHTQRSTWRQRTNRQLLLWLYGGTYIGYGLLIAWLNRKCNYHWSELKLTSLGQEWVIAFKMTICVCMCVWVCNSLSHLSLHICQSCWCPGPFSDPA